MKKRFTEEQIIGILKQATTSVRPLNSQALVRRIFKGHHELRADPKPSSGKAHPLDALRNIGIQTAAELLDLS